MRHEFKNVLRQMGRWLAGLVLLLHACQREPINEALLYDQISRDPNLALYVQATDDITVLQSSDGFHFPRNADAGEIAKALQGADSDAERATYLRSIGCTGDVERYVRLKAQSIEAQMQIMASYPGAKPSMLARVATDYRAKKADRPDFVNIAVQTLKAKHEKK